MKQHKTSNDLKLPKETSEHLIRNDLFPSDLALRRPTYKCVVERDEGRLAVARCKWRKW